MGQVEQPDPDGHQPEGEDRRAHCRRRQCRVREVVAPLSLARRNAESQFQFLSARDFLSGVR